MTVLVKPGAVKQEDATRDEAEKRRDAYFDWEIRNADTGIKFIRQTAGQDTGLTNRQRRELVRKERKQRNELVAAVGAMMR